MATKLQQLESEPYTDEDTPTSQLFDKKHRLDRTMAFSLPSYYSESFESLPNYRPEIKKCRSQPSRSLSPPSLRTPTPPYQDPSLHSLTGTPTGLPLLISKRAERRHLPHVPINPRSNPRDPILDLEERARNWKATLQRKPTEAFSPQGMFFDSEASARTVFGNRRVYAHPHQSSSMHQRIEIGSSERIDRCDSRGARSDKDWSERRTGRSYLDRRNVRGSLERADTDPSYYCRRHSKSLHGEAIGGESGEESDSTSKSSFASAFSTYSERPNECRTHRYNFKIINLTYV